MSETLSCKDKNCCGFPKFHGSVGDIKMLYLIGPDGLVNLSFENFQKMVWMTILNLGMHIVLIHVVLGKFVYLRLTRYADNIRFSHRQSLNMTKIRFLYEAVDLWSHIIPTYGYKNAICQQLWHVALIAYSSIY